MAIKYNRLQLLIDTIRGREDLWTGPNRHVKNVYAIGDKLIHSPQDGNDLISKYLQYDKHCLICRYGTLELETVRQFFKFRNKPWNYSRGHKFSFMYTAGFFPNNDYNMTKFACMQCEVTKRIDILGVRSEKYEIEFVPKYLPDQAKIVDIDAILYPFKCEKPWTLCLKNKKVLVIHPFDETIKRQYEKKNLIFPDKEFLPDFDLITFKPVQGIGYASRNLPYRTWFEALEDMKSKIKEIDFDVALIGAGAYGMFLGDYCKSLGKKAVHVGGALQLFFFFFGKRWDEDGFYNEHWIRPQKSDMPEGAELFECGTFAYW